jgi:parallel beta-helix repeat protein
VRPGQNIQDAVERVGKGGTVRVYPGVYHETVLVIYHGVTIEGVTENGRRPLLDGKGKLADAMIGMGNRFTVQGLEIRNYQGNGVIARGIKGAVFRNLSIHNPGTYAIYPVECDGVRVEDCIVSGSKDAGIYVGQSRNIIVRNNEVYQNVAGIEIENSVGALVEKNYVHDNTGGILVFVLPFNVSKVAEECRVVRNRVVNNNTPNFAEPGAIVGNVLTGTGIMILAADGTEVTENEITGNNTVGIAVSGLHSLFPRGTRFDVDPNPDGNRIYGNVLRENGKAPDTRLKSFGLPGRDLLWDLTGKGNVWEQPGVTAFPPKLPAR